MQMGTAKQQPFFHKKPLLLIFQTVFLLLGARDVFSEPWTVRTVSHEIIKLIKDDSEVSFYEAKILQDMVLQGRFTWAEKSVGPYFSEVQFPHHLDREKQWWALEALRTILGSRHGKDDSSLIFMRYKAAEEAFNLRFSIPGLTYYRLDTPVSCVSLLSGEDGTASLKPSSAKPSIEQYP